MLGCDILYFKNVSQSYIQSINDLNKLVPINYIKIKSLINIIKSLKMTYKTDKSSIL